MNRKYVIVTVSLAFLLSVSVSDARLRRSEEIKAPDQARVALSPLTANVISGNVADGVLISNGATGNVVSGNAIGTNLYGTRDLGNGGTGVRVVGDSSENLIGGTGAQAGNFIAYNAQGVVIGENSADLSVSNSILGNNIFLNDDHIGIDLADDGRSPNHPVGTTGPNNFQNHPVLTSATPGASGLTVKGSLDSVPNSEFLLEFFTNLPNDPEGKVLVKRLTVNTNASGHVDFSVVIGTVPLNTPITATATRMVDGNPTDTSEFGVLVFGAIVPCVPR